MLKRFFDIAVSTAGLVLLFPTLVMVATVIKLTSPGPVFFRQERVGRDFKRFRIIKFRTMVRNAPNLGAQITVGGDPRITSIGKILRKSKVDELPQLMNVLLGDMSLVGPRPEVPKYVDAFHEDYIEILKFRPGITDLASIEYCDENEILAAADDPDRAYREEVLPAKLRLSQEYCRKSSLSYDVYLIMRTLVAILPARRPAQ